MAQMHWSKPYLTWVTIEIVYNDNSRQAWDYDCIQYESLDSLKLNMAQDFSDPRMDRQSVMVYVTRVEDHYTADLTGSTLTGVDFTNEVFDAIDEFLSEVVS